MPDRMTSVNGNEEARPGFPRRRFLAATVAAAAAAAAAGRAGSAAARGGRDADAAGPGGKRPRIEDGIAWHDVSSWGVEGRAFADTARFFDRLPARAERTVRPAVWGLSRHSAGMSVRFETAAAAIRARYTLLSRRLAMPHMPATGVSGLDLYARDAGGADRWLAVAKPADRSVKTVLATGIDPLSDGRPRRYTVYLPLYNGVESLEIGVPAGAALHPVAPRRERPIVFYGTSILQGACASRPGMAFTAILERRLGRPVVNLGFSGNGRMEKEVGAFLCEIDAALYAIDCLPNMVAAEVAARTAPLVRQLRAARPQVPILLVEDRTYGFARFRASARTRHRESRAALRRAFEELRRDGIGGLHYLEGEDILGADGEATTDGSHPNDLGMVRYAGAYEKAIRAIPEPAEGEDPRRG